MKPFHVRTFCTAAVLLAAATLAHAQAVMVEDREPMLIVTGRGQATAEPDRAIVSFGAVAESEEAAAAQIEVNEIMRDAIKAITREGIDEKKLSTSNLVLTPIYDQRKSATDGQTYPRIRAYRASYTLTVVVDEIDKAGDVIDAGLASGINQFQGVQFTMKDDTAARAEALKQAAADAKRKAETIAAAMGVKLVSVKRITESGDYYPPPRPMYAVRAMAAEADMATPVQAGELTIGANVTVEYVIGAAE